MINELQDLLCITVGVLIGVGLRWLLENGHPKKAVVFTLIAFFSFLIYFGYLLSKVLT